MQVALRAQSCSGEEPGLRRETDLGGELLFSFFLLFPFFQISHDACMLTLAGLKKVP